MFSAAGELGLIFVSGVLGSAHCIGMCGGIAATMSLGSRSMTGTILRQIWWSLGRTLTYTFLGIAAAAVGARFLRSQGNPVIMQAVFAVVAGILLIIQGINAAGWVRWRVRRQTSLPCITSTVFSQFFTGQSGAAAFMAGLMTGFLPCGLVYSFLALAASSGNVGRGILIMLSFGLGTVPVMILTGAGLSLATVGIRRKLLRVAGISVLVTGMMTAARGIAFATAKSSNAAEACPICVPTTENENSLTSGNRVSLFQQR